MAHVDHIPRSSAAVAPPIRFTPTVGLERDLLRVRDVHPADTRRMLVAHARQTRSHCHSAKSKTSEAMPSAKKVKEDKATPPRADDVLRKNARNDIKSPSWHPTAVCTHLVIWSGAYDNYEKNAR